MPAAFCSSLLREWAGLIPRFPTSGIPLTHTGITQTPKNAPAAQEGTPGCRAWYASFSRGSVPAPGGDADPLGRGGSQPQETGDRRHETQASTTGRAHGAQASTTGRRRRQGAAGKSQDGRDVAGCGGQGHSKSLLCCHPSPSAAWHPRR